MERLEYRRGVQTQVRHWNPNCPKWPTKAYELAREPPLNGDKCKECSGQAS